MSKCYVKRLNLGMLLTCMVLALVSCEPTGEIPGEFKTLAGAEWPYGQTLVFNEKGDTVAEPINALELVVRHTDAYEYANLWLELSYNSGDSLVTDTFNVLLADDYGKWYGSGKPVIMLTDTLMLRQVPDSASRYMMRHVMRADKVTEIEQLGLRPISLYN